MFRFHGAEAMEEKTSCLYKLFLAYSCVLDDPDGLITINYPLTSAPEL